MGTVVWLGKEVLEWASLWMQWRQTNFGVERTLLHIWYRHIDEIKLLAHFRRSHFCFLNIIEVCILKVLSLLWLWVKSLMQKLCLTLLFLGFHIFPIISWLILLHDILEQVYTLCIGFFFAHFKKVRKAEILWFQFIHFGFSFFRAFISRNNQTS